MTDWLKTKNGNLIPAHRVVRIYQRGFTPPRAELVDESEVELDAEHCAENVEFPHRIIPNANPDIVMLVAWVGEFDTDKTIETPVVAWDVPADVHWGAEPVITDDAPPAGDLCWALLDRRTGKCWRPGWHYWPTREECVAELARQARKEQEAEAQRSEAEQRAS